MESPLEPGRIGRRKSDRLLTIDVHYNEINMVHKRVMRDRSGGRERAVSRDWLDTFAGRLETATTRLAAWCSRKNAWADREHSMDHRNAALAALNNGSLLRPNEFTTMPKVREAPDACNSLVEA